MQFDCKTLSQLRDRVLHEPAVFPALLEYLTVQVSDMFRDPSYFQALRQEGGAAAAHLPVAQGLGGRVQRAGKRCIRWPSCCRKKACWMHLIYATDINPHALRAAESGVFDVSGGGFHREPCAFWRPQLVVGLLRGAYGRVVFDKGLREHMVFSDHSLATDSVFAEVHLVSCRNVLIYFERDLQNPRPGAVPRVAVPPGLSGPGLLSRCGFRRTPMRSTTSCRRTASTAKGRAVSTQHLAPRPAPSRGYAAIVVGGSAGGIDALLELLPALPATLQAAVLVVLHLPRTGAACWWRFFSPCCALPLREAQDKDAITPGSVSFAPPDYHLLVDGGPQGLHVGLSVDPPCIFRAHPSTCCLNRRQTTTAPGWWAFCCRAPTKTA